MEVRKARRKLSARRSNYNRGLTTGDLDDESDDDAYATGNRNIGKKLSREVVDEEDESDGAHASWPSYGLKLTALALSLGQTPLLKTTMKRRIGRRGSGTNGFSRRSAAKMAIARRASRSAAWRRSWTHHRIRMRECSGAQRNVYSCPKATMINVASATVRAVRPLSQYPNRAVAMSR